MLLPCCFRDCSEILEIEDNMIKCSGVTEKTAVGDISQSNFNIKLRQRVDCEISKLDRSYIALLFNAWHEILADRVRHI